jgi:hypothetical protein
MSRRPQQQQQGVRQRGRMKNTVLDPYRVETRGLDLLEEFCIGLAAVQPCNRDTRHMDTDRYRLVHKLFPSNDSANLARSILNPPIFKVLQDLSKRTE